MMRKEPINKALGKIIIEYYFFVLFHLKSSLNLVNFIQVRDCRADSHKGAD